jgi:hypothetical protein
VELNSNEDKWRWGLYPERHFWSKWRLIRSLRRL